MTDQDLVKAQEVFAAWNKQRTSRARAPEHLKEMAISLSKRYPLAKLSRELSISKCRIQNWLRDLSEKPVSFVEFQQPAPSQRCSAEVEGHVTIEFVRPTGGVMKISGRLSSDQLLTVTNAFIYGLKSVMEENA